MKIYFLCTILHTYKNLLGIGHESYCWKDIEDFYNIDSKIKPRLASKLEKIHIELPPFSPM